jgi:Mn2+/Fe2+ NRAMP family transporter
MVALFTLSTITAVVTLQWTPYRVTAADVAQGLSVRLPASFTVAFYILGAAVLHARGAQVTDTELVETLTHMYRDTLGPAGSWIFLLGAFAVLYSTFFVATASNARLFADALPIFKIRRYRDDAERRQVIRAACVALPIASALIYFLFPQPVVLVLIGALGQGLMLPFLGGVAVYYHHHTLRPVMGPSPIRTACLWLAAIAMAMVGVYQVGQTIF